MSEPQSVRDEIREAYVRPPSIFGGYGAEHRSEIFDSWERRIQADAFRTVAAKYQDLGEREAEPMAKIQFKTTAAFMRAEAEAIENGNPDV